MTEQLQVAVIGAGIVGAAAAYELQRRGHAVTVITADPAGSLQSTGATRIFRLAHDEAHDVAAAQSALNGWNQWEQQFGVLLERNGLLMTGDVAGRMSHLPAEHVQRRSGQEHPLSNVEADWTLEKTDCAGRIDRAIAALTARVPIIHGQVTNIGSGHVMDSAA